MDYIRFVNSQDIRKYLYDIDYQLNGEQKLFVVDQCYQIPMKEKIEAFKAILNAPDEEVIIRYPVFFRNQSLTYGDQEKESLHDLTERIIRKYLLLEDTFLSKENNSYYEVKILQKGCLEAFKFNTARLSSFDSVVKWYEKFFSLEERKTVDVVQISKNYLFDQTTDSLFKSADKYVKAWFDYDLNLVDIDDGGVLSVEALCFDTTDKLLVYLPMPFKHGDILVKKESGIRTVMQVNSGNYEPYEIGMPFVFKTSNPDASISKGEYCYDIEFKGFFFDKNCQYRLDCNGYNHTYDLEYYRKPLKGKDLFLKILSMKLKDKSSIPDDAVRIAYEYCRSLAIQKELEDRNECFDFDIMKYLHEVE